MTNPIKVLIVDDSALMRQLLTKILESDPGLKVVGTAGDPFVAREKIIKLSPDVLTLDIEMPRMDGLTFLEKLMRGHPMPVIMISSLTSKGADTTLRALSLGAIDYVSKPKLDVSNGTIELAEEIVAKVKAAAKAKVRCAKATVAAPVPSAGKVYQFSATHKVVAVGAFDRRNRSPQGSAVASACGLPWHRDCAAHAGSFHKPIRAEARFPLQDTRARSPRRRPHTARTRFAGARRPPYGRSAQRNGICGSHLPGRASEPAYPVRGCLVLLLRAQSWQECCWRHAHGNGSGWVARHVGDEASRRIQHRPG